MPIVFRDGGLRFFFYSNEGMEPPHVHVEDGGDGYAKFWLVPVELEVAVAMKRADLSRASTVVAANVRLILEKWHEHFGT